MIEIITAAGGVAGSVAGGVEGELRPSRNQRHFVEVIVIFQLFFTCIDAFLEGLAIHSCVSTPGVTNGLGLDMWKASYIALITILIPLDMWMASYSLCGNNPWGKIRKDQNPYCICIKPSQLEVKTVMTILLHLHMWFEDGILGMLGFGRLYFASENLANYKAFGGTLNLAAGYLLLISTLLAYLIRVNQLMGASCKKSILALLNFALAVAALTFAVIALFVFNTQQETYPSLDGTSLGLGESTSANLGESTSLSPYESQVDLGSEIAIYYSALFGAGLSVAILRKWCKLRGD